MKKSKIVLITIIFVIGFSVLLYFVPVNKVVGNLPFFNRFYNNTSLEINTKRGVAKIWVDGKEFGETPNTIEDLPEGTYLIELEKVGEGSSFYERLSFQIELTKNTSARIDLEIGPDSLLHGSILYYTSIRTSSKDGFLSMVSDVDNSRIFLDGEFFKVSPLTNLALSEGQYDIKIVASGYEDVEVPVLVRNNYSLNLKTFHFPIPVVFESLQESTDE